MKLIVKDGLVIASHQNNQDIKNLYGDLEIVRIPDSAKLQIVAQPLSMAPSINSNNSLPNLSTINTDLPADPRLNWSMEESKANALLVLEDIAEEYRTEILSSLPGKIAGYEAKAKIASRIVASDHPNQADLDALQLEADNRGITVVELAKIILKRSEEFAAVSIYVDGESQRIKAAIQSAENSKAVWDFLKTFEENIINKIGG
jgi:hypothetical protein